MLRYILAFVAAFVLFTATLIPDDALARRGGGGYRGGGGMRAGGFHGGGMRVAHVRTGRVHSGRIHGGHGYRVAGGPRPAHPIAGRPGRPGYPNRPIAGRPGRPIAGYPGYGGGYYRPGWGYGAAAVGAAAAAGAYGYYNNYYGSGCYYDTYGNYVCPGQYPYSY
ncbi:hypothetical protein [Bradyrhizobium sp. BR 10289]|uniref:hypothetical protein n=1 Tax=Bradyrhizobium sp. BR 10289 TaxID=2749993 RepID=UPI001C64A6FD|nr:hypothetical protein [Bradyrhizobium sp. BR 10289]MBW7971378.1 hypothetical protein [Bradyrhizobium sp. BR 10289]